MTGNANDLLHSQTMALLRHRAQAVTSFVGRVPFQFMSDVYTRLVQMEVSMR